MTRLKRGVQSPYKQGAFYQLWEADTLLTNVHDGKQYDLCGDSIEMFLTECSDYKVSMAA